jgi:hypothetical protein
MTSVARRFLMEITVGGSSLSRREKAVVVAGCFMVEQKAVLLCTLPSLATGAEFS